MRIDDGKMSFLQLFRMVRLMICLNQSHKTYAKSMMMQLLILMYQKEKNLPSWQMFMGSPSVFNEEAGEMSFSVLARCCLGDTTKMMFEHMSNMYKLTSLYAETTDVLRTELGRVRKENGYYSLDNKGVEVQTVITFMQESIRALKFNVFRHFTGPLKNDNPAYNPGSGQSELYKSDKVMWIKDVKDIATSWMYKYEAAYSGTWAKDNGLHKILPLYDNDRRVAALSGTHASAHERALAFDAGRSKAKGLPDVASSSSESSEYEFDPPDDREQDSDDPEEKEVEFPKGARAPDVAKKPSKRKSLKFKPVDSD